MIRPEIKNKELTKRAIFMAILFKNVAKPAYVCTMTRTSRVAGGVRINTQQDMKDRLFLVPVAVIGVRGVQTTITATGTKKAGL
jgi:hypothetical protein